VKIVYLVSRGQRSLEQRESYRSERALLGRSRSPILSVHYAVVRCGAAKRDPIALIVRAYARKSTAPRDTTFEMVDIRRFQIRAGRLIMAAVLIEPGYRVRIRASICTYGLLALR